MLGVLLGRFICGFLCPFGWFQELLHKIPFRKLPTKKLKPLRYLKYAVLLVAVIILPAAVTNDTGLGDPFFCKYICPQGVLEGAIPLSLVNEGIRAALGTLFVQKLFILIAVVALSILFYRPFCKWICPLGAFYASCKMDVDVRKTPNHAECIRCGKCITACPAEALCFHYGFGSSHKKKEQQTNEINMEEQR